MLYPRLARRALIGVLVLLLGVAALPARAEDYPLPTHGQGKVNKTRVTAGSCVIFSGDGFQAGAGLTLKDDGVVVGYTRADALGNFKTRICFATTARLGRHVLLAEGIGANTAFRDVTASVTVVGASTSRPPPGGSTGGGTTGNGTTGNGTTGNGTGGGTTGNGTTGNGTGGGTGNGTGNGNGQPAPGSVGSTTGTSGTTSGIPGGGPVAAPELGDGTGIGNLALYGGLLGALVMLSILYLLWRDKRARDGRGLPGLTA